MMPKHARFSLMGGYGPAPERPTITVENYIKWYSLWLRMPDGTAQALAFPEILARADSAYRDHVPNPMHVALYARERGYDIEETALEIMIGRWVLEAEGHITPKDLRYLRAMGWLDDE